MSQVINKIENKFNKAKSLLSKMHKNILFLIFIKIKIKRSQIIYIYNVYNINNNKIMRRHSHRANTNNNILNKFEPINFNFSKNIKYFEKYNFLKTSQNDVKNIKYHITIKENL